MLKKGSFRLQMPFFYNSITNCVIQICTLTFIFYSAQQRGTKILFQWILHDIGIACRVAESGVWLDSEFEKARIRYKSELPTFKIPLSLNRTFHLLFIISKLK